MPRPRIQVDTDISRPGFRPVASPNPDTFRRTAAGQGIARLAAALSGLVPELSRYAQVGQNIEDEKTLREAERKAVEDIEALREAETTYAEARRDGLIQEHQDPIFRARYQELVGRNLGESAMAAWQLQKAESLSEATTLEEFDQEFNDFYTGWTDENLGEADEPALNLAYRQTVQGALVNDRRAFAVQAGARLSNQADETFHSTIYRGVLNRAREGRGSLTEYVSDELEAHLGLQTSGSQVPKSAVRRRINRSALEGGLNAAEALALSGDQSALEILEALSQVPTGPGGTLGSTSWGHDMLQESTAQVLRNLSAAETLHNKEQQATLDGIMQSATEQIFDDPTLPLTSFQQQVNQLGIAQQAAGAAIRSLEATRTSILRAGDRSNPDTVRDIELAIFSNPVNEAAHVLAVRNALASRDLNSGDAQNLYNLARTYGSAAKASGGAFKDDAYDRMHREFLRLFGSDEFALGTPAALQRQQADAEYNRAWREWLQGNPEADVEVKETFLLGLSERLVERYDVFSSPTEDVPRDPRLRFDPAWQERPVMSSQTYGILDAIINEGIPLDSFPLGAQEALFGLYEGLGLQPGIDDEVIARLLEAQAPFFLPENNDPQR